MALRRFQRVLDFQHLLQVEFTFGPGEAVVSGLHPAFDGVVGGKIVIHGGVGAGQGGWGELLDVIEASGSNAFFQRHEHLSFNAAGCFAAVPKDSAQIADGVYGQRVDELLFELPLLLTKILFG